MKKLWRGGGRGGKTKFTYAELLVVARKTNSVKNGKGKGLCGGRGQEYSVLV